MLKVLIIVCFIFPELSFASPEAEALEKLANDSFKKAFVQKNLSNKDVSAIRIRLGSVASSMTEANYDQLGASFQRLLTIASFIKLMSPSFASALPVENYWVNFNRIYKKKMVADAEIFTLNQISDQTPKTLFLALLEKYHVYFESQKTNSGFLDTQFYLCKQYSEFAIQTKFETCIKRVSTLKDARVDPSEMISQMKANFYLTQDLMGLAEAAIQEQKGGNPGSIDHTLKQFFLARLTMAKGDIVQGRKIFSELESTIGKDGDQMFLILMWRANISIFEGKLQESEQDLIAAQKLFSQTEIGNVRLNGIALTRAVLKYFKQDFAGSAKDINEAASYFYPTVAYTKSIYPQLLKVMINRRLNPAYVPKDELAFFTMAKKHNQTLNTIDLVQMETEIGLLLSQPKFGKEEVDRLEGMVKYLKKRMGFCVPILPLFDDFIKAQRAKVS